MEHAESLKEQPVPCMELTGGSRQEMKLEMKARGRVEFPAQKQGSGLSVLDTVGFDLRNFHI